MTGVYHVESARGGRVFTSTAATYRQAERFAREELAQGADLVVIGGNGRRVELRELPPVEQPPQLALFAPAPAPDAIRGGL